MAKASRIRRIAAWSLFLFSFAVHLHLQDSDTPTTKQVVMFTSDELDTNPYLGWQPLEPNGLDDPFSWRTCFEEPRSQNKSAGCREDSADFGIAPSVEEDWVPDVTMIRKMVLAGRDIHGNPFPPPLPEELCEDFGANGEMNQDSNKRCLHEAGIRSLGPLISTTIDLGSATSNNTVLTVPAPKLMCLVYTMKSEHATRIRAIRETWAGGCDGFLAFSTESDPRLPAISIKHDGPESYDNMWQKIRSIWKFVAEHYLDDYDWFHIGGDDIFLLPYNLKLYLANLAREGGSKTDPKQHKYYVGRRFRSLGRGYYFNSGGAGYSLSQATLRELVANIDDAKNCNANEQTSKEDIMVARCLNFLNIHFRDTRDAEGKERFHHYPPGSLFNGIDPNKPATSWYAKFNREWGVKIGKDCCAPDSVSFHYIKEPHLMRHLQALLYSCDQ